MAKWSSRYTIYVKAPKIGYYTIMEFWAMQNPGQKETVVHKKSTIGGSFSQEGK